MSYPAQVEGLGKYDLLYIDQHILKEIKTKEENIAIEWIDKKKGIRYGPAIMRIDCLKMYKLSREVKKVIDDTMKREGIDSKRKKLS